MGNLTHLRRRLSEGVASWLSYEFHCGRGELFSEKYIAHPVGSLLAAQLRGQIQAEYNHPILTDESKSGRRPQIDFAIFESTDKYRNKSEHRNLISAVESKWLSRTEISADDIAWDLFRLDLIAKAHKIECYFILAGLNKKLQALFQSPDFQNIKRKNSMIPLGSSVPRGNLIISQGTERFIKQMNDRKDKYPGVTFPEKITVYSPHVYPPPAKPKCATNCRLVPPNQTGDFGMNLRFSVYTWKIGEKKKEPNNAMEPTPVNVTVPAGAGPAPFTSAAHLER